MMDNDINNVRLVAAYALVKTLVSTTIASQRGLQPDTVSIVDFSEKDDTNVIYPLGDPSGVTEDTFVKIQLRGGTSIGSGIKAALDELTKPGTGDTKDRSGIVVFTDGKDDPPDELVPITVSEIKRAAEMGVRVSFGFLKPKPSVTTDASDTELVPETATQGQDLRIVDAILAVSGTMADVDTAGHLENYLKHQFSKGMTGIDQKGAAIALFPGVSTSERIRTAGTSMFGYTATAGETFNITVEVLSEPKDKLKVDIKDASGNFNMATMETDSSGVAFWEHKADSPITVEVSVNALDSNAKGIFRIGLKSNYRDPGCVGRNSQGPIETPPATITAIPPGSAPASPVINTSNPPEPATTVTAVHIVTQPGTATVPSTTNTTILPGFSRPSEVLQYTSGAGSKTEGFGYTMSALSIVTVFAVMIL